MKLPAKKQYKIIDLLYRRYSVRKIAKQVHVSPTTVEDYKKKGPPFYREHSQNTPTIPPPASWSEERNWFIQKIKELEQRENNLIQENNQKTREKEKFKQENETFKQELILKNQQIDDIQENHRETLKKRDEKFEILKSGFIGATKELKTVKQENYDLKLKELQRKKEEAIAKTLNSKPITQSSLQDIHNSPEKHLLDEIDAEEEDDASLPWDKIALTALVFVSSVYKGYQEGKNDISLSTPSQSIAPSKIVYNNQTNQKKNIIQPVIQDTTPQMVIPVLQKKNNDEPTSGTSDSAQHSNNGENQKNHLNIKISDEPGSITFLNNFVGIKDIRPPLEKKAQSFQKKDEV